jgi:hypothetical protein
MASLCLLPFAFAARGPPVLMRRAPTPAMSIDATKTFKSAEWWKDETATLLDLANVMGRWESATEWMERSEFAVVDSAKAVFEPFELRHLEPLLP